MRSGRPCLIAVSPISPSFNRGPRTFRVERPPMRIILLLLLLSLQVWAQTPQLAQPGDYEYYVHFLGNRLLTVETSRQFWVWDVAGRKLLANPQGLQRLLNLAGNPNNRYLVATDYPSCARVYSLPEGRPLYVYQPASPVQDGSYQVQFSSDGSSMLLLGSAHGPVNCDPQVRQVDLATGREIRSYDFGHKRGNQSSILCGKNMLMARAAGTKLQLWDLKSGNKIREISLPDSGPDLRTHSEGIKCRTGNHTTLYSWEDLHKIRELEPASGIDQPAQSPDGKLSWSQDEEAFKVTRNADQKVIYQGPTSHSLEKWLTLGFQIYPNQPENRVDPVYDLEGKKIGTLPRIMIGYPDHPLITDQSGYGGPTSIYDYQKLKLLLRLPFATQPAYSPDGKILAMLTKTGVLLIDIPATLAAGKIVPLR